MNLIKNRTNNTVIWYGREDVYVNNGVYRTASVNLGIPETEALYVENVPPIDQYFPNIYAYDTEWKIIDEEEYNKIQNSIKEQYNLEQSKKRHEAYIAEADPIFFKAQRGEATVEDWEAKVALIKQRFPKL